MHSSGGIAKNVFFLTLRELQLYQQRWGIRGEIERLRPNCHAFAIVQINKCCPNLMKNVCGFRNFSTEFV